MLRMASTSKRPPRAAWPLVLLVAAVLIALPTCWCSKGLLQLAPRPSPLRPHSVACHAEGSSGAVGDAGTTPLMLAAYKNDEAEARRLAAEGAELDSQDAYGWTALRYAVRSRQLKTAKVLIELGADVNLASSSGRTPLMSAAANGMADAVQLLLEGGADPSLKNDGGETALELASRGGNMGALACRDILQKSP
mmetsp:Transcript_35581/g.48479  ORF Transcript_35581/g.48479 Transcript_35581/m.48479 type:complete len:194 (-) Transcript_35581:177-758(-)